VTTAQTIQVQVAHEDRDALSSMIATLVDERLVACGQIVGPVSSTYRWQGAVRHAEEWLALLKTSRSSGARLLARIAELHSYEVPEVLVLEVSGGHEPYLEWVTAQTG
jgi:periplasmic divalent cation tolerance protein